MLSIHQIANILLILFRQLSIPQEDTYRYKLQDLPRRFDAYQQQLHIILPYDQPFQQQNHNKHYR